MKHDKAYSGGIVASGSNPNGKSFQVRVDPERKYCIYLYVNGKLHKADYDHIYFNLAYQVCINFINNGSVAQ